MAEPITREEIYLDSIANGEETNLKPITREEMFLAKAGGQNVKVPTPITRKEKFLSKISGAGNSKPEQEKTVEITKNGTTEITADEGKTLSKVTAVVNVPTSTVSKLPQVIDDTVTEITAEDLAGATKIRGYAFWYSSSLTSITIPSSVKNIGSYAFENCKKLKNVTIDNGVEIINNKVFDYCTSLTNITIPDSVTSIGDEAFNYCSSLASVTIGNGVTNIGNRAFQCCVKLTNVKIGNSVKTIKQFAFASCNALTSITIPASVTSIGSTSLQIGNPIDGYRATITFLGTTPPTMSAAAFKADYLEKIIVPKGCGEAYKTATNWANFADYIEEAAE